MAAMVHVIVLSGFVACLICAIIADVRVMRIPNWISLALIVLFMVDAVAANPVVPVTAHFMTAGATLALTFMLFAANCLGAGDAKLLAALGLWMGPSLIAPFLAVVGILGGIFVLFLMTAHALATRFAVLNDYAMFARSSHWMRARKVPYGVPICLAASAMVPALF
jgi:prepilin peptidase CpaA